MEKRIIICPDTHGRTFWKKAVENLKDDERVIFLGDYLDPYHFEGIHPEDALVNFEEILDYKKADPGRVTLLLGNHDLHYFLLTDRCRVDTGRFDDIKAMFRDNLDLFDLGTYRVIDGRTYTFTHAPVTKGWLDSYIDVTNAFCEEEGKLGHTEIAELSKAVFTKDSTVTMVIDRMNFLLHNDLEKLRRPLSMCPEVRGGYDMWGSPVWADYSEVSNSLTPTELLMGAYQIFGHTQQLSTENEKEFYKTGRIVNTPRPVRIEREYACVDSARPFIFEDGVVKEFEN